VLTSLIDEDTFIGFRYTVEISTLYRPGRRIRTLGELKERHIDFENLYLNIDGAIV